MGVGATVADSARIVTEFARLAGNLLELAGMKNQSFSSEQMRMFNMLRGRSHRNAYEFEVVEEVMGVFIR